MIAANWSLSEGYRLYPDDASRPMGRKSGRRPCCKTPGLRSKEPSREFREWFLPSSRTALAKSRGLRESGSSAPPHPWTRQPQQANLRSVREGSRCPVYRTGRGRHRHGREHARLPPGKADKSSSRYAAPCACKRDVQETGSRTNHWKPQYRRQWSGEDTARYWSRRRRRARDRKG